MRNAILLFACLATVPIIAHAAKCTKGKSTLYTQASTCPAGYTDVTAGMEGNVSFVGKTGVVQEQERDYLSSRDAQRRQPPTQPQSASYSAGRCQRLMLDQNMLLDQLRRTGWKLEQDAARAQLTQVQEEIIARGC
jgi:hypothetical protein